MPRLGLTMRIVSAVGYNETRDSISHDWLFWLAAQNIEPVLIPNAIVDPVAYACDANVDGLILSSGNDVSERQDGGDYSILRNRVEDELLKWAKTVEIPVFGVCRGLHMINAYFGGQIRADIPAEVPMARNHIASQHSIALTGAFAEWLGAFAETNSYHRQGLIAPDLAPDLAGFAFSSDGVVEGLVHRKLPILAVQWHPERAGSCSDIDRKLISRLLSNSTFWREWLR